MYIYTSHDGVHQVINLYPQLGSYINIQLVSVNLGAFIQSGIYANEY